MTKPGQRRGVHASRLSGERLTDRFCAHARKAPQAPALFVGEDRRSYGELLRRAEDVAAGLDAGLRVAILLTNSAGLVEAALGTVMAGSVAAILNAKWSAAELDQALRDVAPDLIVTSGALRPRLGGCDAAQQARIVVSMPAAAGGHPQARRRSGSEARHAPDAPFYIGFTSGTSGVPKAYVRSHRSWLASLDAAGAEFPALAGDRVLIPGALAQSMFFYALVETLSAGAAAYLLPRFDSREALDVVARETISRIHTVPAMLAALSAVAEERGVVADGVRMLLTAGDKLAPAVRTRAQELFPNAAIAEYYGASELSFVSVAPSSESWPEESVGRVIAGVEVAVRNDAGVDLPAGAVGRLWVRSDMVCSGYLRDHGDLGFRMQDGWATVGDLARIDDAGAVYLAGREDGMVISGGNNIYPAEVEAVLRSVDNVADAVVVGVPDGAYGQALAAVVQWRGGKRVGRDILNTACRQRLAAYKCPRRYYAIAAMPVLDNGKTDRKSLRQQVADGSPALEPLP